MTKDEALDLALAYIQEVDYGPYDSKPVITAIKQARALDKKAENARELGLDYEPVQDSTCNETLRAQGKAYPRTCRKCGLGPCIGAPKPPPAQPAPVQSCYCPNCEAMGKELAALKAQPAPVQSAERGEPVADVYMAGNMQTNIGTNGRVVYVSTVYSEKPLVKGDKLYTTPPAPAVPDAIHHTDLSENLEYIQGWNDCRAEMLRSQP
jgi:hypothetical protein